MYTTGFIFGLTPFKKKERKNYRVTLFNTGTPKREWLESVEEKNETGNHQPWTGLYIIRLTTCMRKKKKNDQLRFPRYFELTGMFEDFGALMLIRGTIAFA